MDFPSYDSYKDCEIDFLTKIPSHWTAWKVTHGFELIGSGTTPKSSNPAFYDGDTPWITTAELRENIVSETKQMVSEQALNEYSALKVYEPGALAIAMYGATIGRLGILGVPATVNQACCVFDKPEQFDIKFFFYWLWMHRPTLISLSVGGGQPNLSQDDLKQLKVPAPPIPEQIQIAKFLDYKTAQIDRLIEKKKALIERLNEQRIALITHAVTKGINPDTPMKDSRVEWLGDVPEHWEIIPVKFALDIPITDGPHETPELLDDGVPFISAEAVKNDRLDFYKKRGFISVEEHKRFSKKYSPNFGDVYMVKSGATTGNVARVETHEVFNIWSPLAVLRPKPGVSTTDFLFYFLKSQAFKYSVELSWSYGTQQNIGMGVIANLKIALPPYDEQTDINTFLGEKCKKIDKMLSVNNQTIKKLSEYKTALITASVTGKIDIRDIYVPEE